MKLPFLPKLSFMRAVRKGLFLLMMGCVPGFSLLLAQQKGRGADTTAILQMLEKGDSLSNVQPDEARVFFEQALRKSREAGYHRGVVMALTKTGNWYFGNDMALAIHYGRQALDWYEQQELADMNIKAPIEVLLAEAYDERGVTDSSAYFFYLLTDEMENTHFASAAFATNLYIKLAVFFIHLGYDTATNRKALSLYIERARRAAEGLPESSAARRNIYFLKGLSFQGTEEYDSSRYYFQLFLAKSPNLGVARKMSTYLNIASTWIYMKRPDLGLDYIDSMALLARRPGHEAATAYFINETNYLRAYAWVMQERYSPAIPLLQQYLQQSEGKGKMLRFEMMDAHRMLASCYERMGMYKEALEETNIQLGMQDSLSRRDRLNVVSRMEMRYRIVQKDKMLTLQKLTIAAEREKVRKRNSWIGIILLLALVLTLTGMLWQRYSRHKQNLQAEKLNRIQQDMEITRLQATVTGEERERKRLARELHDGVGGIVAAASLSLELCAQKRPAVLTADYQEGLRLVKEAAGELRRTAHNMLPDVLETKGLVPAIRSFVSKISHQYTAALVVQSYGTEQRFSVTYELAVYRIVQELVNNILKHARAQNVLIQIDFIPAGIAVTIEDDGIGMTKETQNTSLNNIHERVRAAGGSIDIESSPGTGGGIYMEFILHEQTGGS